MAITELPGLSGQALPGLSGQAQEWGISLEDKLFTKPGTDVQEATSHWLGRSATAHIDTAFRGVRTTLAAVIDGVGGLVAHVGYLVPLVGRVSIFADNRILLSNLTKHLFGADMQPISDTEEVIIQKQSWVNFFTLGFFGSVKDETINVLQGPRSIADQINGWATGQFSEFAQTKSTSWLDTAKQALTSRVVGVAIFTAIPARVADLAIGVFKYGPVAVWHLGKNEAANTNLSHRVTALPQVVNDLFAGLEGTLHGTQTPLAQPRSV